MTTALILAGGLGTRLRSMVSDVPKPMAPVQDKPFIQWVMDYWIGQGVSHFILCLGYMSEAFESHFGTHYRNVRIDYSVEDQPLGTGGALVQGLTFVKNDDAVLVLNGDTFFDIELDELTEFATRHQTDWCLSLSEHHDTERYMGIALSNDHQITSLNAKRSGDENLALDSSSRTCLINAGVYLVRPSCVINDYPTNTFLSLENQILPDALSNDVSLYGLISKGNFIDIGTPTDYLRADSVLKAALT